MTADAWRRRRHASRDDRVNTVKHVLADQRLEVTASFPNPELRDVDDAGLSRANRVRLKTIDGNESEPTIHRVMVWVAGVTAVALLGRAVQDFVQMFAVPRAAAEASQGKGQGGRKLVSLMDERCAAAIPYSEARSQARPFGRRRV
jgi:hypothetical protein